MTRHQTKATVVALIASAGMFSIFAPSLQAQALLPIGSANFPHAQEALQHQIIARQVQLVLLGTEVANAANVTTSDRSALATILTNEQTALAADATNAASATTDAGLKAVRQAVVGDERVYAVVTAQVHLVDAADNYTIAEGGYTGLTAELGPLVTELGLKNASTLLADVTSEVTAATSLTTGVSTGALALSPTGYPGNESQIKTYTFQLGQVKRDLSTAREDVKQIEAIALNAHRGHVLKPV